MEATHRPEAAYAHARTDRVREHLEAPWLAALAAGLLPSGARRVLELGCGAGLGAFLGEVDYTGVDFRAPGFELAGPRVDHDLRDGLGPVGTAPFDLYVGGFGLASHLAPAQLQRLLGDIARHGRSGSMVMVEALGLFSLEWPRLWSTAPGAERTAPYRLADDVEIHPWAPEELGRLAEDAGLLPLAWHDRTVQAGPKLGDDRYWPPRPDVRAAIDELLGGAPPGPALTEPLPPLPAGPAAELHQRLAARRRAVVAAHCGSPEDLARGIWALEPRSGGGFGHGLVLIARVP